MQKKFETYIHEGLPSDEEDGLWVEFLLNKRWFWYYAILYYIYAMARQDRNAMQELLK